MDGQILTDTIAKQPREDLRRAHISDGRHGARIELSFSQMDGKEHDFTLLAQTGAEFLLVDQRRLKLPAIPLQGRVERFQGECCVGWVRNPLFPDDRLKIEAIWNKRVVAHGTANVFRRDLLSAQIGDGKYGFRLPIPGNVWRQNTENTQLTIQIVGDATRPTRTLGTLTIPSPRLADHLVKDARYHHQQGQLEQAKDLLDKALQHYPDHVDALWMSARLAMEKDDREQAKALAERAWYLYPGHPRAAVILARLTFYAGQYKESLSYWKHVSEQDSAYRESLLRTGRCLLRIGHYTQVIEPARKLLAMDSDDHDGRRMLAEAYTALELTALALSEWQKLSLIFPEDRNVQRNLARLQNSSDTRLSMDQPEALMVLENAALHNWFGSAEGKVKEATRLGLGLTLRPTIRDSQIYYTVTQPQEFKPNGMPFFGLKLSVRKGGAALAHTLESDKAKVLEHGIRLSFEIRLDSNNIITAHSLVILGLEDSLHNHWHELWNGYATVHPRLVWFDLRLNNMQIEALKLRKLSLTLKIPQPTIMIWNPPRPVCRLLPEETGLPGYEGPDVIKNLQALGVRDTNLPPRYDVWPDRIAEKNWDASLPYMVAIIISKIECEEDISLISRSIKCLFSGPVLAIRCRIVSSPTINCPVTAISTDPRVTLVSGWSIEQESAEWFLSINAGSEPPAGWPLDIYKKVIENNQVEFEDKWGKLGKRSVFMNKIYSNII
ncbi:hypothetical protein CFR75_16435 [Komagataeibacter xylinus]|uniref:Uncharacterized protein n=2 Tax=Komagataeibacter xylinus TaxID=28448 RepID=A0A318PH27_KOMXY|nr:hypothetical protein CFR75_16435 [Komagataeibacter xylinus]GBQ70946.1 hypothetical protein AA15237_0972 [Komagataeibacter xylinus NBRC 15237]